MLYVTIQCSVDTEAVYEIDEKLKCNVVLVEKYECSAKKIESHTGHNCSITMIKAMFAKTFHQERWILGIRTSTLEICVMKARV